MGHPAHGTSEYKAYLQNKNDKKRQPTIARNIDALGLKTFITPHMFCSCGGKLSVARGKEVEAHVYGFSGVERVKHITKRCGRDSGEAAHAYNFKWCGGSKFNTVRAREVDAIIVSDKVGFCKRFLEYHDAL